LTGLSNRAQMVGGGRPLLPDILDQNNPLPSKTAISNLYSVLVRQPQNLAKKVQFIITYH